MENKCFICIKNNNKLNVIRKLVNNKIFYENLRVIDEEVLIFVNLKYVNKIKKLFKKKNVKLIKYYGIYKYKKIIKDKYISLISVFIGLFVIFILSNIIFDIRIETNNIELKRLIKEELEEYGIKKYNFKKSYEDLTVIKEKIIKNNKDKLEWIEFEVNGTKYVIKVTERKLNKEKKSAKPRSLIAKKDGVIKKMTSDGGVLLKEVNDYVKKGEVIITGNIVKGEDELKGVTRANGRVYAEVWYLVNVSVPYNHKEYVKTNNSFTHYYIEAFDKKMSVINYYKGNEYRTSNKKEIEKFYIPFKLYKETVTEYKYKNYNLTRDEAYSKGINKATEKVNDKLKNDEYVISKKVLKKDYFSSKIVLEVFFKVYEDITSYTSLEEIKKGKEE